MGTRRGPQADLGPRSGAFRYLQGPGLYVGDHRDAGHHRTLAARETILAQIEPSFVYTYDVDIPFPPWIEADYRATQQLPEFDGAITILDAWGTPMYSTHPGAPAAPGVQPVDTDGTERTLNESYYGIARNRQVCFVSAGPDRLFGLYWEFTGLTGPELEEAMAEAMKDNIYSYRPELPQPTGYPGR